MTAPATSPAAQPATTPSEGGAATPTSAPAPKTASTPSTPAPAPSSAATARTEGTPDTPSQDSGRVSTPDPEALRAHLRSMSADDLIDLSPDLKRAVDGRIGSLAHTQAQTLAQHMVQQELERREDMRDDASVDALLSKVRSNDVDAYAAIEEIERIRAKRAAKAGQAEETNRAVEAQNQVVQAVWRETDSMIEGFFRTLPVEVQRKLSAKKYPGGPGEARLAFLKEAAEDMATHREGTAIGDRVEREVARRMAEAEKAIQSQKLADAAGREPSVDTSAGTPAHGALTVTEWAENAANRSWRIANKPRINAALKAGVALTPV